MDNNKEITSAEHEAPADPQKPFPYRFPQDENKAPPWRLKYEEWWINTYKDHIPEEWLGDKDKRFEKTRKIQIGNFNELTDKQVKAVLTESNHLYGLSLLGVCKATPEQFALFLAHPELSSRAIFDIADRETVPDGTFNKLAQRQLGLGMTTEEINEATVIALKLINERADFKASPIVWEKELSPSMVSKRRK